LCPVRRAIASRCCAVERVEPARLRTLLTETDDLVDALADQLWLELLAGDLMDVEAARRLSVDGGRGQQAGEE
jgi:hypothetical protein